MNCPKCSKTLTHFWDMSHRDRFYCETCNMEYNERYLQMREEKRKEEKSDTEIMAEILTNAGITSPAALGAFVKGDIENAIVASTPGGIEAQEAQGQRGLADAEISRLPMNGVGVYGQMGIEELGVHDDLFVNVKLPEGWKVQPTEHSMHSDLLDEKGRKRGGIFYKAAFYDLKASFNTVRRFSVNTEPEDAYKSDASYEERSKMANFGRVYDNGTVVFETEGVHFKNDKDWQARRDAEDALRKQCETWLKENGFENHEDFTQYWD